MSQRIRRCIECPKCRTRYLVGFSPYGNGTHLVRPVASSFEEYVLYCSCTMPPSVTRWNWDELRTYAIASRALKRGYGPADEIVDVINKRESPSEATPRPAWESREEEKRQT